MTVHGAAHNLREQQAGRADDAADRDQQHIANGHTGDGSGHARGGVEQGDGDGHVRAAHRQGKQQAEDEADSQCQPGIGHCVGSINQGQHGQHRHANGKEGGEHAVAGQDDGFLRQHAVQLARGNHAAGEGERAHAQGQQRGQALKAGQGSRALHGEDGGDGRGQAAQAVEQPHHLGHGDHLDALRHHNAHHQANGQADEHVDVGQDVLFEQYNNNRRKHGKRAQAVAAHGGGHLAHPADAKQHQQAQYSADDVIQGVAHW